MASPTFIRKADNYGFPINPTLTIPSFLVDGTDRMLIAVVTFWPGTPLTSIVFNGSENFTRLGGLTWYGGGDSTEIWYLVNPTATTADVVATGTAGDAMAFSVLLLNGAAQSAPRTPTTASGVGTSATVNATSVADDLVLDALGTWAALTFTEGAGQTSRTQNYNADVDSVCASTKIAVGTSTTMSWTLSTTVDWGIVACAIPGVGGGSSVTGDATIAGVATTTCAANVDHVAASTDAGVATTTCAAAMSLVGAASDAGVATTTCAANVAHTGAATDAGVATTTCAANVDHAAAATDAGVATTTCAANVDHVGAAVDAGIATTTCAANVAYVGAATGGGTATTTATAAVAVTGAVNIDGLGTVTADGTTTTQTQGAANIDGTSTITVSAAVAIVGAASDAGTATTTGAAVLNLAGAASFSGTATTTGAAVLTLAGAANLDGTSTVTASGTSLIAARAVRLAVSPGLVTAENVRTILVLNTGISEGSIHSNLTTLEVAL